MLARLTRIIELFGVLSPWEQFIDKIRQFIKEL